MPYANKKDTDHPVYVPSLIIVFVICCQDSTTPIDYISKISRLLLAFIAKQASLSLTWSQTVNLQRQVFSWSGSYEPRHDKTNKMSVRPVKTDQPGHLPSLIRVFAVCSMGSLGPKLSSCEQRRLLSDWAGAQADPPSLIRVFAGRTLTSLVFSWSGSYVCSIGKNIQIDLNRKIFLTESDSTWAYP